MIDEALQKNEVNPNKFYSLSKLYDVMLELGLTDMKRSSFTTDWINRRIEKGVLTLPPKRGYERWKLTGKQIEEIVRAFIPGGSGAYHYNEQDIREDAGTETSPEEQGTL